MSPIAVGAHRTAAGNTRAAGMGDWEKETRVAWMEDAACAEVSVELFVRDPGLDVKPAKRVCAGCDVREQCLAYAVEIRESFGVWGGLAPRERRVLEGSEEQLRVAAGVERARNRARAATSTLEENFGVES